MPVLDSGYYYKLLAPGLVGLGLAADVFGGARENVAFMAPIGGYTSQLWRFVPAGDGAYSLSTLFRGPAFCAEAVDGGPTGELRLTRGASPAKAWVAEPVHRPALPPAGDAAPPSIRSTLYVRLWTLLRGPGWSLDLAAGSGTLKPALAERSDGPGQTWLLARTDARTG
jgi:hypothetical protein